MYKLNEIVNCYIFENANAEKYKMLGKIVRIKERIKGDLGKFSLTLLKGQYV
jgi:hypothetical protein